MRKKIPGFVEWFKFNERKRAEDSIKGFQAIGVDELRICISWADWVRPGSLDWFNWLIKKLRDANIKLFPWFFYTPQQFAMAPNDDGSLHACPPVYPKKYAEFIKAVLRSYPGVFEWVGLWNEPNNSAYWRQDLDPGGRTFAKMIGGALEVAKAEKVKTVLGSITPPYANWLSLMQSQGLLAEADAISIHDFPGTWNDTKRVWSGWANTVEEVRAFLTPNQQLWISETGFSTRTLEDPDNEEVQRTREIEQVRYFESIRSLPGVEKYFWYSFRDEKPGHKTDNERRPDKPRHDPRSDGFGIITYDGKPKPLYQHLLAQATNPD